MKLVDNTLRLAATDLSNHVACGHLTTLSLANARGEIASGYTNFDPLLKLLQERGHAHEAAYTQHLRASGKRVESGGTQTLQWMTEGVDIITQASLERGAWHGRADFLVRVDKPSREWAWSYEVIDTKLSSETRAGTVLQLCVYSDVLATVQGSDPEWMHVVKPGPDFPRDSYRFDEYSAIYRALRSDLEARVLQKPNTYPEPTANCDTCNWRDRCDAQRRDDDHLSLVADLGRNHRRELERHSIQSLTALAQVTLPWPHKPERGSAATYERLTQQARLQYKSRGQAVPHFELLPLELERGLARLPAPSELDVFLDFEGDMFIGEHGREFLFGWYTKDRGYEALWALDDSSERAALEQFVALVMDRWTRDPGMHVYHFAPYEPTALKRLVGRFAVCLDELDRLLRGRRLIDLYSITRQAARIGVESYSIKSLEPLIGYTRPVPLSVTGPGVHQVKLALQRGTPQTIEAAWRGDVEAYNRGDCESTLYLRDWLETLRAQQVADGETIDRPPLLDGRPDPVRETLTTAAATAALLLLGIRPDRVERTDQEQARWLLGHMMEWYRREGKVTWWEYFRLLDTTDEQKLDEQKAIAGLTFVEQIKDKLVPIERYRFPPQELFLQPGEGLITGEETKFGTVRSVNPAARTIDIKKTRETVGVHASSVFAHKYFAPKAKEVALVQAGTAVAERGFVPDERPSLVRDLLFRKAPRGLVARSGALRHDGESIETCAIRLALALDGTVLPIQGPPGTGKTWTAAKMILALAEAGLRVGVTATSHSVIENLVTKVVEFAHDGGQEVTAALKRDEPAESQLPGIYYTAEPKEADELARTVDVLGATAWQWARTEMKASVDVLFIDEAGQMCLTDAVSVCEATRSLVLVGDPQQLEQPIQGTHPDGVAVSVLQHMVGDAQTIAPERGLLLDETHRLSPSICPFTSEQFYERKLRSAAPTALQGIAAGPFIVPGLYWRPVEHSGNQNRSLEEADVVAQLVASCFAKGAFWTNTKGKRCDFTAADILIVAPYNAHAAAIRDALALRSLQGVAVGTVDKFQGKEAAIAIYTMATSCPEDAPRGLSFLYDRHRLNVATSRARCVSVVVANPSLLRPVCSTPKHLHLASALSRYVELAYPLPSGAE
jgi:predicted RecB family nuclease